MSRKSSLIIVTSAVAVLAAFLAFFVLRGGRSQRRAAAPPESVASAPLPAGSELALPAAASILSAMQAAPSAPTTPPGLDEPALMRALRELRGSNPALTLQLARDGNERFKDSADAAERSWFVVKSLTDLGRHDEARLEGRRLVEKYRDTRWAEDVYRHLFVNPPTHPFERGYGKTLELED